MAFFTVHYSYADDAAALDAARPDHRAFLRRLAEAGHLKASGPLDTTPPTALLVFENDSAEQVDELLADDPFQRLGLVPVHTITAWNPVIGVFASE